MADRNPVSQSTQARVVDAPGPEKVSVGTWYELEPVAWAYAHRIEDVGWESDLARCGDLDDHGAALFLTKTEALCRLQPVADFSATGQAGNGAACLPFTNSILANTEMKSQCQCADSQTFPFCLHR